jgi:hypothetical protein
MPSLQQINQTSNVRRIKVVGGGNHGDIAYQFGTSVE